MEAMRRLLCSNCHKELELTSQEALEGRMEIDQPTETRTLNLFGEGDVAKHKAPRRRSRKIIPSPPASGNHPENAFLEHGETTRGGNNTNESSTSSKRVDDKVRNKTKKVTEKVPKKVPKKVTNEVEGENGASKRHNGNANNTTFLISLDRSNILENASQEASFFQPVMPQSFASSGVLMDVQKLIRVLDFEIFDFENYSIKIKGSLRSKSTGRAPELLLDYPIDASWLAVTWMYCGGSIAGIALVPLRSTILFCYFFGQFLSLLSNICHQHISGLNLFVSLVDKPETECGELRVQAPSPLLIQQIQRSKGQVYDEMGIQFEAEWFRTLLFPGSHLSKKHS
ncbi:hypothetical protein AAG906_005817 [Vitis piasezkii]